jgi:hypothetical protein
LQELIAPDNIHIYDSLWKYCCTKKEVAEVISQETGIPVEILSGSTKNIHALSVAQKMSWAWSRQTTREEDRAYCLLGIFNINMPLIYGEGQNAFIRLQEEIMRKTNDLTILAWLPRVDGSRPILAPTPRYFERSGNIVISRNVELPEFTITNKGLRIQTPLWAIGGSRKSYENVVFMPLLCHRVEAPDEQLCISLRKTESGTFRRVALRIFPIMHKPGFYGEGGWIHLGESTIYLSME